MKPVISVKEACKILGKLAKDMTDEQVEDLVYRLDQLAKAVIEDMKNKRLNKEPNPT
jgi:hypothetical protein